MAKKNNSRLSKKKKRKVKRELKKREQVLKYLIGDHADSRNVVSGDQQRTSGVISIKIDKFQADQRPSTSQNCRKQLSPKKNLKQSPWKSAGGKVNRFKKLFDDQTKNLVGRSVYIVHDNQSRRIVTSKKHSTSKKSCKRLINNSSSYRREKRNGICGNKESNNDTTLEEGEILSETNKYLANTTVDGGRISNNHKNCDEEDDDCIIVEPTIHKITIDDERNEDDDMPFTSDQSIIDSFKERVSSTPFHNKNSISSYASVLKNSNNVHVDDNLPFFIDVGRGCDMESINSTDTFVNYTKLTTLRESSPQSCRSVRSKEIACNEIIDLDDTSSDNRTNKTLKHQSKDPNDDSVIFISETNTNHFISIVDNKVPPDTICKRNDATTSTPAIKLSTNNLFTRSELKKLDEYNENAYNPRANESLTTAKRMVIIDGSNVAFKHGLDQAFSVKGLKIAIEYFEKMGHEVKAVIPQFRMNKTKSTDPEKLEKLNMAGKIVQTPCKALPGLTGTSYDDRFILQLASVLDAAIVSNDNYRDLLHENPAFKKIIENRVIGYTWCNDIFILPKDPYGRWGPHLHTILNRS